MKEYEIYSDIKVPMSSNLILRIDGRNFHQLSKKIDLQTPFDYEFIKIMVKCGIDIFKEFSPLFIYIFSDEINILFNYIPFSGRIEKINSVFPSLASSSLTLSIEKLYNNKDMWDRNKNNKTKNNEKNLFPITFDSRIIPLSKSEVLKYFKWRQDEAYRNFVNSHGYWALKEKYHGDELKQKLNGFKTSDIHEYLFKGKKINLGKLPFWQRRGIGIYKKNKIDNSNNNEFFKKNELPLNRIDEISNPKKFIFVDEKLPMFNKEFFNTNIYLNENP
ncbi:MAG: guanylyltransferase [Methanobrevibacter sp.]|jgi:tRNA(His) 5'-end guanylyltransferase|nr:guanylyltransferase [Methanobrevibacter sp.]